jgi:hypothetical protein
VKDVSRLRVQKQQTLCHVSDCPAVPHPLVAYAFRRTLRRLVRRKVSRAVDFYRIRCVMTVRLATVRLDALTPYPTLRQLIRGADRAERTLRGEPSLEPTVGANPASGQVTTPGVS